MFKIKSFLLRPGKTIENLEDAITNYQQYFIAIDDKNEMTEIIKNLDRFYIEGAIIIYYYDKKIMDFDLWDLIDQLWSYIVSTIKMAILNGEAETYFPDQPVKIIIKDLRKSILFQIQVQNRIMSHVLPRDEFLQEILKAAKLFFQEMINYDNEFYKRYKFELEEIESIKNLVHI